MLQCIVGRVVPSVLPRLINEQRRSNLITSPTHPSFHPAEDKMLAENIPVPSSPVPIATIELITNSEVMTPSVHQEPKRPAQKTRHQEEQEDDAKPAWALSVSPFVTIAFVLVQMREVIVMRKAHTHAEVQPLQVTWGIMGNTTRVVM